MFNLISLCMSWCYILKVRKYFILFEFRVHTSFRYFFPYLECIYENRICILE